MKLVHTKEQQPALVCQFCAGPATKEKKRGGGGQIPWRKVNIFSQELKVLQGSLFSGTCLKLQLRTLSHLSQTGFTHPKLYFLTPKEIWLVNQHVRVTVEKTVSEHARTPNVIHWCPVVRWDLVYGTCQPVACRLCLGCLGAQYKQELDNSAVK